jgi:predicted transcriptional regulator
MAEPKLGRLELQIRGCFGPGSMPPFVRFKKVSRRKRDQPYTTVQTTVYRLESKKAVRRVKKVGNFHIFEAAVTRDAAQGRLVDDLIALFGGRTQPVMSHLIESGKLTLQDVREAERTLRKLERTD